MQALDRLTGRTVIPIVVPPLLVVTSVFAYGTGGLRLDQFPGFVALVAAACVYLLAHILRAVRLSVMATRIIPLRVRTLVLLHFNAAPSSLLVPFKLGELYRLQQLSMGAGNVVRPVLIILLDRTLDAVVVLALAGISIALGGLSRPVLLVSVALSVALIATVLILTVVRPGLASLQAYVLLTHFSTRTLKLLRLIDFLRRSIELARDCLRGNLPLLLCLSVFIWLLEAATLLLVAPALFERTAIVVMSSLSLALIPGTGWADQVFPSVLAYLSVTTFSLLLVWPFATAAYVRQLSMPVWRSRRVIRSEVDPGRLTASEPSRVLRLFVARRSL